MTDERQAGLPRTEAGRAFLVHARRFWSNLEASRITEIEDAALAVAQVPAVENVAFYCVSCAARLPVEGEFCTRCADERGLLAECAEVCTSGCHADDCEHHGHLPAPDERQAGLRSKPLTNDSYPGVDERLDGRYRQGHRAGWEAALAVAQVPAEDRCPVCGTPGRVVSGDEGTAHFEAAPAEERLDVERLARAMRYVERTMQYAMGVKAPDDGPPDEWYDGYARAIERRYRALATPSAQETSDD